MLKAGIYVDLENINRTGGYGVNYSEVRKLVEAQGSVIVRANAYIAKDEDRENSDPVYRKKKKEFRDRFRRTGFRLVHKLVKRYTDVDTGETTTKANADLDLAIDALLQAENLDYILLLSGDGDFLRLVRALQNRDKRVDLLSFGSTSNELREEVDHYFPGYLFKDILPYNSDSDGRYRGLLHTISANNDFGFLIYRTDYKTTDIKENVFIHVTDVKTYNGDQVTNDGLVGAYRQQIPIEFSLKCDSNGEPVMKDGKPQAINARFMIR